MVLLLEHPIASNGGDRETIDGAYISNLLREDWGFYYTVTTNLDKVGRFLPENAALDAGQADVIRARLDEVGQMIEDTPKSRKWRMRAKVGTEEAVVPGRRAQRVGLLAIMS